jgi:hypothetical protein
MTESERVITPRPETAQPAPEPGAGAPRRRREPQDATPLLVELAWLVIEAATVASRLRRILARL